MPKAIQTRSASALRRPLLIGGGLTMATGLYAGLVRLGWPLPIGMSLADLHGALMVSGFFGTVISLERAVALKHGWAYLAPIAALIGTFALLFGLPPILGTGLFVVAGLAASGNALFIVRLQPALFTSILFLGAACWLVGNILLMAGVAIYDLVGWWLAFFVLTIAAERLELSRVTRPPRIAQILFVGAISIIIAGATFGFENPLASQVMGAGFVATSLWLWAFDIARITIRYAGQTRFFAVALMAGYFWLGVAGLVGLFGGVSEIAFGYDIMLHAVLIGFVMSMVFAHALIILPAVAGIKVVYSPWLYGPLVLLHASVAMRILGGIFELYELRKASGVITIIALLSYGLTLGYASFKHAANSRKPL